MAGFNIRCANADSSYYRVILFAQRRRDSSCSITENELRRRS